MKKIYTTETKNSSTSFTYKLLNNFNLNIKQNTLSASHHDSSTDRIIGRQRKRESTPNRRHLGNLRQPWIWDFYNSTATRKNPKCRCRVPNKEIDIYFYLDNFGLSGSCSSFGLQRHYTMHRVTCSMLEQRQREKERWK